MPAKRLHEPLPPRVCAAASRRTRGAGSTRAQRGSVAVIVALFMTVVIAALGALDVGNVFFARRSMQRIADLAALAGAQRMDSTCTQPSLTATENAAANGFTANGSGQTITIVCGRWDIKDNSGPSYFSTGNANTPWNAVQVTVTRTVPYFFLGPSRQVNATATAQATDIGAFTIGTTLAQLQGGLVNSLLNSLLGANLNLSLVSYESLASARVKIRDLMAAAGASTVSDLLSTQVSAAQLANLMSSALARTTVPDANLQADLATLQAIANSGISNAVQFPIGNGAGAPGLLSLSVPDLQSTLDATISPLDGLVVAAEIARAGQAPMDIAAGLNIGGLGATLKVQIIEPPVLAVGEAGVDPVTGTWRTQAHTAQVRLYLKIALGTPSLPLLGSLGVDLPVALEAVPGQAWLEATHCLPSAATSTSVVGVQPGIANVCVGDWPANPPASQPFTCTVPATLVNAGLITVTANAAIPAVVPLASASSLTFDGISGNADDYQSANSNAAGGVLANALSGLSASLAQPNGLTINLRGHGLPLGSIASALVTFLSPVLDVVLAGIDQAVDPLLQLLGVQVSVATIHDLSLTCGASQLVN